MTKIITIINDYDNHAKFLFISKILNYFTYINNLVFICNFLK